MKYVDYEYIPEMIRQMKVLYPKLVVCADSLTDIRRSMQEADEAVHFLSLYRELDAEKMSEVIHAALAAKILTAYNNGEVTGYDIAGAIDCADVLAYTADAKESIDGMYAGIIGYQLVDTRNNVDKLVCGDTADQE